MELNARRLLLLLFVIVAARGVVQTCKQKSMRYIRMGYANNGQQKYPLLLDLPASDWYCFANKPQNAFFYASEQ